MQFQPLLNMLKVFANLLFDLHKSEINGQVLWVLSN